MSQQAVWHPHRTSTAPAHRRHRSSRLLLAAALLALPLSACAGQLTSAPNQATQEVTVKATALSAEQITSLEADANTGPDMEFPTLPTENSTITVLINWQKKYRKPLGTTLVSRNRSDGALKWAVTITPPGASRNALENADAPQHNVSDLMTSHTSGEIVVSPDGRRVSLILTPHHGQLDERLAEQESYVVVLDATSGAVVRSEELNGVILGQGLTNGSLAVETANDYFPGGSDPCLQAGGLVLLTLVFRHRSVARGGRNRLAAAVTAAALLDKRLRRINGHPGGYLREGPRNHQGC